MRLEAEVARELASEGLLRPDVLPDLVEAWPDVENEKSIESEARPPGSDSHSGLFSVGHSELPQRDELRDLARRLGVLNNHLSLVFTSPGGELLALGDVQGWSLRRIADLIDTNRYRVALAPHHGFVKVPVNFPNVDLCILQNGPAHYQRRHRHYETHQCTNVLNTEQEGHIQTPPWWFLFL